jgi:catechol 2,3-dioxygenase-like lactoylglutathione lyase family enzyme
VLHHVSLEVPPEEAERMVEFWRAVGFEPVDAPGELAGMVSWVEREGTQIHLIHTPGATAPALGHAAVVPPDFDDALARLTAAGFEVEPARELWGEPRAFALAPGGHRVELMRAPPHAAGAGS